MNRKSFALVVVMVLAVAGFILWRAGIPRVSAGTIQPDVASLALVPNQATTVFGMDIDGLRSTPIYAAWRQKFEQKRHDKDYDEFVARTGFDVERDLEAVTAAAWKDAAGTPAGPPQFLAVVTARYAFATLSAFLKEKGASVESYRGFEILGPEEKARRPGHSDRGALVFLDGRTIVAGTGAAVKQALDLKLQPGASVLSNTALIARVQKIGAENQLWAVSTAPGSFLPMPLPPAGQANVGRVLQGLQGSTFAINAASGLNLLMEGSCASSEDARTLADAARGIMAMLRLAAPADRPQALELLNSFQVEQDDNLVRVTGKVSAQLLDQLIEHPLNFIPRRHGSAGRQHHGQAIN